MKIEKDWNTAAGFRAVVNMLDRGHRCGYVGVPKGHPLHGVAYNESTPHLGKLPDDEKVGHRGIITLLLLSVDGEQNRPDVIFDVHGSLTYSDHNATYPVINTEGTWWFGFDCAHAGDAPSPEREAELVAKMGEIFRNTHGDVHRSLGYCVEHCERLAAQIVERTIMPEMSP